MSILLSCSSGLAELLKLVKYPIYSPISTKTVLDAPRRPPCSALRIWLLAGLCQAAPILSNANITSISSTSPADNPEFKRRVVASGILLVSAKLLNVSIPIIFKAAIDAMTDVHATQGRGFTLFTMFSNVWCRVPDETAGCH